MKHFRVGLSEQPVSSRSMMWRTEFFRFVFFLTDIWRLGSLSLIKGPRTLGSPHVAACDDRRSGMGCHTWHTAG